MVPDMSNPSRRIAKISELDLSGRQHLSRLLHEQIAVWPGHEPTLATSVFNRSPEMLDDAEENARIVTLVADTFFGGVRKVCEDYRYFCQDMILEAELYFRRHGRYQRSTFEEANRDVYSNPVVMQKYMNGLLLSGVFWHNHAYALKFYRSQFLPMLPQGYTHLEIGPGHGALLHMTLEDPRAGDIYGWDVSPGAIEATRRALELVGSGKKATLVLQDMFEAPAHLERFDSIVVSELLEHLEDPARALQSLITYLKPGGRILVNMPANSPAPDHLYLIDKPEEMLDLIRGAGFAIEKNALFPMTGYDLDRCLRDRLTINCVAVGRRPPA
jgi:SAM-dependent methyltransferase